METIAQRLAKLIAHAIKVQTGKGPENVAVCLYRDRLTIRASGCLLPLERNLAKNANNHPLLLELRSRFVREDFLGLQDLLEIYGFKVLELREETDLVRDIITIEASLKNLAQVEGVKEREQPTYGLSIEAKRVCHFYRTGKRDYSCTFHCGDSRGPCLSRRGDQSARPGYPGHQTD